MAHLQPVPCELIAPPKQPVIRYHGGKFRLSPWVQQYFPDHTTYVEPFGGAASVLLTKPRSFAEVYNDLDGEIVNLFRVLQDRASSQRLVELCQLTPYARAEFNRAWEPSEDPIEQARRTIIRAQMGFGAAGATKGKTGFRIDTQREYGTAQHLWVSFPPSLAAVTERFIGVLIENRPAIEVLRQHDTPQTLHYVDPPYLHSTRVMQGGRGGYYRHEMDDDGHAELLSALASLQGMVVLSGYRSALYDQHLHGWQRVETQSRIAAARGAALRTECLWLNPATQSALRQQDLFPRPHVQS